MNLQKNSFALLAGIALCAPLFAQAADSDFYRRQVFGKLQWKELGPVIFGGRVVDLAVHPKQPQVFWVASASGGIFKTTNGGLSFEPQFQDAYSISIGDIAVAPSAPDTLYVGTGECNNQRSSYWGDGVHKSTDGGKTWKHVGLKGTDHIGRIAVHPTNADIVFVAALGALYSANPERGLYHTTDGGETWTCVKNLGPDTGFVDVLIDPKEPEHVYAASYERRRRAWHIDEGGDGSRLWQSSDAGKTWTELGGALPRGTIGRIGIDLCASNPNVLYATIENLNPAPTGRPDTTTTGNEAEAEKKDGKLPEQLTGEELADPLAVAEAELRAAQAQDPERAPRRRPVGGEVYRSDDQGRSWRKVSGSRSIGGSPGYYYGQVRVDPSDAETCYVLSVPVYCTRDGGKTWAPSGGRGQGGGRGGGGEGGGGAGGGSGGVGSSAFASGIHVDHHALWIDPRDGQHALLGNDGGLHSTWDGGRTWDTFNHLPIAQFYAVAVDHRDNYRIYGGLQDNGTYGFFVRGADSRGIGRLDAERFNGGDGFHVAIDPDDPDIVYSESQFGAVSRANLRTGERKGIRPRAAQGSPPLRSNWSTPIVLSPHSGHTVYVGTQYLHRSRNRGDHWETISPDLTTSDPEKLKGNVPHCTITTIAESQKREGMLWVGTDDGKVWLSRNGGQRWTDLGERFPAEVRNLWVSRVECSPFDADTAWVAFSGYREDVRKPFLFLTTDGGETFRSIANDLPQEPINVVKAHPRNKDVLLVGTEFSAYVSGDQGASWYRLGGNLPRTAVHDLVVHARLPHVIVGTHGRGIWAMDAQVLEQVNGELLAKDFHVFPASDGALLRRAYSRGNRGERDWNKNNPFTDATFRFYLRQEADEDVKVEVVDAAGKTLWTAPGAKAAGLHEIAWATRGGGRGGFGQGREPGPSGPTPPGGQQGQGQQAQGPQGQGPERQGQPGGGQGGGRGGGAGVQRAGRFAIRVTHGDQVVTLPFQVRDLRGPRSPLGSGVGVEQAEAPEEGEEEGEEEEAEAREQASRKIR